MSNILVVGGSSGIGQSLIDKLIDSHNVFNIDIKMNDKLVEDNNILIDLSNDQEYSKLSLIHDVKFSNIYFCTGIAEPPTELLKDDFEFINKIISTNASSLVKILAKMHSNIEDGGSVVVVSSAHSLRSADLNPIYSGTKGFMDSFVRSMAKKYIKLNPSNPIRINAVNPEMVNTPLISNLFVGKDDELNSVINSRIMKRLLTPDEVVNVMLFLGSELASGITGNTTPIGGNI